MMINTSKLAFMAAAALVSFGSPVFAQTPAATAAHRHHYAHRPLYDYGGYQPTDRVAPGAENAPGNSVQNSGNPVDQPSLTGGGTAGYNECAGHPRC